MCSTSRIEDLVSGLGAQNNTANQFHDLVVQQTTVRRSPDDYVVVDIRGEPDEREAVEAEHAAIKDLKFDQIFSLGGLLRAARDGELSDLAGGKKILCVCNIGYRSRIAARELRELGLPAYSLHLGTKGWLAPASITPDFVVTLSTQDVEKVTFGLSAAANSAGSGKCTAVCLTGAAVELFLKPESDAAKRLGAKAVADIAIAEPFKPVKQLLGGMAKNHGIIFACTTCLRSRGIADEDLIPGIVTFNMPDLLRFLASAPANLQMS